MTRFITLVRGEILRLNRYNLFAASIFVSIMWVGILHFIDMEDISMIVPQLIFLDITTMATMLIGVTSIYEKEENTLRALLVSPINKDQYLLSKLISNILPSILSLSFMFIYGKLFKTLTINYLSILLGVMLVSFFHSLIGLLLTYHSKNFTDLLIKVMLMFFVFVLPVLLDEFKVISSRVFQKAVYVLPTKSALMVIMGTTGIIDRKDIGISIIYMLFSSLLIYVILRKGFEKYSLKESGE